MEQPQYKKEDLEFGIIDKAGDPNFQKVYECYSKCFTLESERESQKNFEAILKGNGKSGKPGKEMWVYAKDKHTGEVVGASNFDAFAAEKGHGVDGTVQAIYMLVAPEHRTQGLFGILIEEREKAASQFLKSQDKSLSDNPKLITFAEQNNPLMMTPRQYLDDTEAAGIDQSDRRTVFEKKDFQTLNQRYVQPPLEKGGEVCDYLDLVAKVPEGMKAISSPVIEKHFENFFKKSFIKGTSIDTPGLEGMKRDLSDHETISLSPKGKFQDILRSEINVETLSKLPEKDMDKPIGELYPQLVEKMYGKGATLEKVMDSMSATQKTTKMHNALENAASAVSGLKENMTKAADPSIANLAALQKNNVLPSRQGNGR